MHHTNSNTCTAIIVIIECVCKKGYESGANDDSSDSDDSQASDKTFIYNSDDELSDASIVSTGFNDSSKRKPYERH